MVAALWVLNAFDAVATHYGVSRGYAEEANPLMSVAMEHSWLTFYLVKMALITVVLTGFARAHRVHPRLVNGCLASCVLAYGAVAGWHVYGYLTWGAK